MFQEQIAEKVKNIIGQNWEQIEKDWQESRKESEEPKKLKYPFNVKVELTNIDGNSPVAKIKIEWAVVAKRSIETAVDGDATPELPLQ